MTTQQPELEVMRSRLHTNQQTQHLMQHSHLPRTHALPDHDLDRDLDLHLDVGLDLGLDRGLDLGCDLACDPDLGLDLGLDLACDLGCDHDRGLDLDLDRDLGLDLDLDLGRDPYLGVACGTSHLHSAPRTIVPNPQHIASLPHLATPNRG